MNNHYSNDVKKRALYEVIHNNKAVSKVALEFNLVPQTLYRWIQDYKKYDTSDFVDNTKNKHKKLEIENAILKKSRFLNHDTESIFKFIFDHKNEFAVSTMCEVLDVSSSGYYKWLKHIPSNEEVHHNSLKQTIEALYVKYGPNIGSPALTNLLLKQNINTSQSTVARILRNNKHDWHRKYSKFHHDKQIALDFPTKNSVWCSTTNNFYNIKNDLEAIKNMLCSHSFANMKKYDWKSVSAISDFKNTDNLIIKGDNLIVLHQLTDRFKGKVQLVYFDPPYNNNNYNTSYPNAFSQSTYLTFIQNRLQAIKPLLKPTGIIFIQCSNHNQAQIKILCDEIFEKDNFVSQLIWRRTESQQNRAHIASVVDYILVYAKNRDRVKLNKLPLSDSDKETYRFQDAKGFYRVDRIADNKNGYYHYDIVTPEKKIINGTWKYPKATFLQLLQNDEIDWSEKYPYKKVYLHENTGKTPSDLWSDSEHFGSNQQASRELKRLFGKDIFTYPKPELLMYRIIQLATDVGDTVLDPFLGSATTTAVAHKMRRQYIGIERLDYIEQISVERMKKVISGDKGGISSKVNWTGGNKFVYAELKKDSYD